MALLLLKITGLWRFAGGMKFVLEFIDENQEWSKMMLKWNIPQLQETSE